MWSRTVRRLLFGAPDVVVSLDAERRLLTLVVENVGSRAAHDVAVSLDPPWEEVAADVDPDAATPFAPIGVVPPGGRFRTVLAPLDGYDGPRTFESRVRFRDDRGRAAEARAVQTPEAFRRLREPPPPSREPLARRGE
ncbi:hypothetical protein [Halorubrum sp. DTA46]|uniref:hypothetical protein n=1 Tax=Halorubrum sp. DTA46 TaxID=3402162 RepID=UPI003AAEC61B